MARTVGAFTRMRCLPESTTPVLLVLANEPTTRTVGVPHAHWRQLSEKSQLSRQGRTRDFVSRKTWLPPTGRINLEMTPDLAALTIR
jgi:hypothetical protein